MGSGKKSSGRRVVKNNQQINIGSEDDQSTSSPVMNVDDELDQSFLTESAFYPECFGPKSNDDIELYSVAALYQQPNQYSTGTASTAHQLTTTTGFQIPQQYVPPLYQYSGYQQQYPPLTIQTQLPSGFNFQNQPTSSNQILYASSSSQPIPAATSITTPITTTFSRSKPTSRSNTPSRNSTPRGSLNNLGDLDDHIYERHTENGNQFGWQHHHPEKGTSNRENNKSAATTKHQTVVFIPDNDDTAMTRQTLTKFIQPAKEGIAMTDARSLSKGKMIIDFRDQASKSKFDLLAKATNKIVTEPPRKLMPTILLKGVRRDIDKSTIPAMFESFNYPIALFADTNKLDVTKLIEVVVSQIQSAIHVSSSNQSSSTHHQPSCVNHVSGVHHVSYVQPDPCAPPVFTNQVPSDPQVCQQSSHQVPAVHMSCVQPDPCAPPVFINQVPSDPQPDPCAPPALTNQVPSDPLVCQPNVHHVPTVNVSCAQPNSCAPPVSVNQVPSIQPSPLVDHVLPSAIQQVSSNQPINNNPPTSNVCLPVRSCILIFNPMITPIIISSLSYTDFVVIEINGFIIASVYSQPGVAIEPTIRNLDNLVQYAHNKRLLVAGDFNAKSTFWGPINDERGEELLASIIQNDLCILNDGIKPTFDTTRGNRRLTSFIDLTLVSQNLNDKVKNWTVRDDIHNSDHRPIITVINNIRLTSSDSGTTVRWSTANIDWSAWSSEIGNGLDGHSITCDDIDSIDDRQQLDLVIAIFTNIVQQTCDKFCVKYINKRTRCDTWHKDNELRQIVIKQRQVYRKIRQCYNQLALQRYKNEYQQLRQQYRDHLQNLKFKAFDKHINGEGQANCFQKVSRLIKNSGHVIVKTIDGTNSPAESTIKLVDALFPTDDIDNDTDEQKSLRRYIDLWLRKNNTVISPPPISMHELHRAITKFKDGTAPGYDGISPKILKNLWISFPEILLAIYNACLRLNYMPYVWKTAIVRIIPKPGKDDYSKTNAYRPIGLLSTMGKAFERIIANTEFLATC
ncbi:hypothetical protein DERF_008163 [Dermatophagoides farinae]|uniref:Endonuclease/exonuclease/phosphatase domain-containing protein n=1 Tax=Dermatophagoides farinae TaxID=6954 RepID=A0A922I531_DERFA|nr:hypothetical protein DERF_008163 [Dermatophagoides farinae]